MAATAERRADKNRSRTTDTFADGKKFHFFKGAGYAIEDVLIVQHPSGLTQRLNLSNVTVKDVAEQIRIDEEADFEFMGPFSDDDRYAWNLAFWYAKLLEPDMLDSIDEMETAGFTDAEKEKAIQCALYNMGVPWVSTATPAATLRTVKEGGSSNQRPDGIPGGTIGQFIGAYLTRTAPLTSGEEIDRLQLWSDNVLAAFDLMILKRTGVGTYDVIRDEGPFTHEGTNWENFDMQRWQVPATGSYFLCVWTEFQQGIKRNAGVQRSISVMKPTGTGFSMTEDSGITPSLGVRFQRDYPHPDDFGITDSPIKFRKIMQGLY